MLNRILVSSQPPYRLSMRVYNHNGLVRTAKFSSREMATAHSATVNLDS